MSLVDYASSAHRVPAPPSPLPPQAARRRVRDSGFTFPAGWPASLLPAPEIAADLLARGVTFRRGVGYAEHGAAREPDQIARLVPDLLDEVANALPTTTAAEWEHVLGVTVPEIEARTLDWAANAYVDPEIDDERVDDITFLALWAVAPLEREQIARLPQCAANDARNRDDAAALRKTADDLRISVRARRLLLDAVRPHLSEQSAAVEEDDQAAAAWIATLDDRLEVRRSEVSVLYSEAGSPGAVPPARLRALAEDRWGAAVKVRGHYLHRPASAAAH